VHFVAPLPPATPCSQHGALLALCFRVFSPIAETTSQRWFAVGLRASERCPRKTDRLALSVRFEPTPPLPEKRAVAQRALLR
jgi:hypothetical protein